MSLRTYFSNSVSELYAIMILDSEKFRDFEHAGWESIPDRLP